MPTLASTDPVIGLTNGEAPFIPVAPFIKEARDRGEIYISQPYELYSDENHETWRRLYARMVPRWDKYANQHFLDGVHSLCLNPRRAPRLEEINGFLGPLTGFQAKAVS